MEWIVVKTVLSLAGVLALMIGVVLVLKKLLPAGRASSSNVVEMKLLGTMMLQPKRSVAVVKIMNTVLILGMTEEGIQPLGEISDEQSLKELDEKMAGQQSSNRWPSATGSAVPSFARALALQLGRLTAKGAS
jgi:flagellar biogenesis protein FliO